MAFSVSESFFRDTECLNCPTEPPRLEVEHAVGHIGLSTASTAEKWWRKFSNRSTLPIEQMPGLIKSLWDKARAGTLKRLEPLDCINDYATSESSICELYVGFALTLH
jgi:hypothetical protein